MDLGINNSFGTASYEVKSAEKQLVYEPAEDTHILLDALAAEWTEIQELRPQICVEVGCGCGVISCTVSKQLKNQCAVFASDISTVAVEVTRRNAALNEVNVEVTTADLLTCWRDRLRGSIDLLLFNPPYVPTDGFDEVNEIGILARAWCGGNIDGTAVLNRLLPDIPELLSPKGRFYVVAIAANRVENLLRQPGLRGSVVLEKKQGIERLYVLKFVRSDER